MRATRIAQRAMKRQREKLAHAFLEGMKFGSRFAVETITKEMQNVSVQDAPAPVPSPQPQPGPDLRKIMGESVYDPPAVVGDDGINSGT